MRTLESINATWQQTHGHVNGSIWNGLFIVPQAAETKKGGKCQVVIFYQGKNSIFWLINICSNSSFVIHHFALHQILFTIFPATAGISCMILWSQPLSFYFHVY